MSEVIAAKPAASRKVAGHALRDSGAAFKRTGYRSRPGTVTGSGYGLCECGAMTPGPLLTPGRRRQWHREHKAAILAGAPE